MSGFTHQTSRCSGCIIMFFYEVIVIDLRIKLEKLLKYCMPFGWTRIHVIHIISKDYEIGWNHNNFSVSVHVIAIPVLFSTLEVKYSQQLKIKYFRLQISESTAIAPEEAENIYVKGQIVRT